MKKTAYKRGRPEGSKTVFRGVTKYARLAGVSVEHFRLCLSRERQPSKKLARIILAYLKTLKQPTPAKNRR